MDNPVDLLLNKTSSRQDTDGTVVSAPAFSLTKVMAVVAPLITALVSTALSRLKDVSWSATDYVWMIVSLVAFLAVTASADVVARAIATSAQKRAEAAVAAAETTASARTRMVRFAAPVPAFLPPTGPDDRHVHLLAASDAETPEFLCLHDDRTMTWETAVMFDLPPLSGPTSGGNNGHQPPTPAKVVISNARRVRK